jgi:hypothetical protein
MLANAAFGNATNFTKMIDVTINTEVLNKSNLGVEESAWT